MAGTAEPHAADEPRPSPSPQERYLEAAQEAQRSYVSWKDRFPDHKITEVPETEEERRAAIEKIRKQRLDVRKARGGVPGGVPGASGIGPTPLHDYLSVPDAAAAEVDRRIKKALDEEATRFCIWCGKLQDSIEELEEHEDLCAP